MRVVEKGWPLQWLEMFTCKKCSSVLEVGVEDLEKYMDKATKEYVYKIQCPCCNHRTDITSGLAGRMKEWLDYHHRTLDYVHPPKMK